MVSFKSLAASLAVLPGSMAYIYNMTSPATASAGKDITATLYTSIYIQNYNDFGIIWGLGNPTQSCDGCVGEYITFTNLM